MDRSHALVQGAFLGVSCLPRYLGKNSPWGLLLAVVLLQPSLLWAAEPGFWLLVDTQSSTLKVMEGRKPRLSFDDVAIGRFGASRDKVQGDRTTPLGRFSVAWMKPDRRFHYFIGLSYPNMEYADRAFHDGRIEAAERDAIRRAIRAGRLPPQTTPLGGGIGIHGLGAGDPEMHRRYNWTQGCVALTDAQLDRLLPWVKLGMPVVIQ